jgi:hypothetical protein
MLQVMVSDDGGGYGWSLIRLTPSGADILAKGSKAYEDEASCRGAVALLGKVAQEALTVVRHSDGHWCWQVADPAGAVVAESPPVFRDAGSCVDAFDELENQVAAQRYY